VQDGVERPDQYELILAGKDDLPDADALFFDQRLEQDGIRLFGDIPVGKQVNTFARRNRADRRGWGR
jgi:hypothetical protein